MHRLRAGEFARDFRGTTPYIVREISWNVRADNTYASGGALGLKNPGVAALEPGYDHSAVPGREPLIVPREDGAFFERQWIRFLRAPTRLVHIETWNEYHEGTDIAASRDYGRQYIELNRKFVEMFKAGIKLPRSRGPYSDFETVRVTLQATNDARGLTQFEFADGRTAPVEAGGRPGRAVVHTEHGGRYVYFQIHDSFKWADSMRVDVEVEYFDQGTGSFFIEYDGPDANAPFNGAYTASPTRVTLGNSGTWKKATFRLAGARFLNSQNGGADFRLAVQEDAVVFGAVAVSRLGMPDEAGAYLRGWQQDFAEPLDPAWQARGEPGGGHRTGDLLRVGASVAPALLLLRLANSWIPPVEILARIRPVTTGADSARLGALGVALDPESGTGFLCALRQQGGANQLGLVLPGESAGSFVPALWATTAGSGCGCGMPRARSPAIPRSGPASGPPTGKRRSQSSGPLGVISRRPERRRPGRSVLLPAPANGRWTGCWCARRACPNFWRGLPP